MRLFEFQEKESGVTHTTMANNEDEARGKAIEVANRPFEPEDYEWIHPEQVEKVDLGRNQDITLHAHSNPITHTKRDWETIYEQFDEPLYLGCSEY